MGEVVRDPEKVLALGEAVAYALGAFERARTPSDFVAAVDPGVLEALQRNAGLGAVGVEEDFAARYRELAEAYDC